MLGARPHVVTNASDPIPPARERTCVEDLDFGLVEDAVNGLAFRLHPNAIEIAANPRLVVPSQPLRAMNVLPLELIEQHAVVPHAVVHGVAVDVRKRPLPILFRDRGHRLRILRRRQYWAHQHENEYRKPAHHSSTRTSRNMPASM